MTLTEDIIKQLCKANKDPKRLAAALNQYLPKYDINTPNRISGFLAQCGHESLDFTVLKENLNYSMKGLTTVFRKYFPTEASAKTYERKPNLIANKVYASRMGNGNEASGDGWKYRGRGAIQLTGKNNYTAFAYSLGMTLDETILYLDTLEGAIESACWFWNTNGLNAICDRDDILTMTKKINGGTHGLDDRTQRYTRAKNLIK